jgi:hypothetical protein
MRAWGLGLAAAVVLAAGTARADEPGLTAKVYDPYVRNGVTEIELYGGRLTGGPLNGETGATLELERGLNDRVSLALVGEFEDHAGEKAKLDSLGLEAVTYLGQVPGLGVDVGGYLEYEQRLHAESGILEAKLLLAKQAGPVHVLVNLIAKQPLSNRPDERYTDWSYATRASVDVGGSLQLGVEAFGGLGADKSFGGRNSHYVGPVANWELRPRWAAGELEFEASYLLPAGAARDVANGQLHFGVEYERKF